MIFQVTAGTKQIVEQRKPRFMARLGTALSVVVLVLLGARVLPAAEPPSLDSAPAAADQLKALNDQTIIQSSVWLDTEWEVEYTAYSGQQQNWPVAQGSFVQRKFGLPV